VLPGAGGIEPEGGFYRQLSASLTKAGATVVIVHYMDRSGLTQADNAQMSAHFAEWLDTIHASVDFVAKQLDCAHARIGLLGHSLGAQLALHEASSDLRVDSVIDMAGSFVRPTKGITHMPRVLILHGRADSVVPITREKLLVEVLKRTNSAFSEHIFPRSDHQFSNVTLDELSALMIKFLKL
jgi:carboxymethylenebutenolidase